MKSEFGEYIRNRREELLKTDSKFSLRRVAALIEVQPSFLSKVERGESPPPSEPKIVKLAEVLGEDSDELLALAGKISGDPQETIRSRPILFAQLIRNLKHVPDDSVELVGSEGNMELLSSSALDFVKKLVDYGIDGVGPLSSADSLGNEYLNDTSYCDNDARVDSLIKWESSKNFTSGLLTGLGGIITLPAAVPAALGASWIVQARMCGTIAKIYGHEIEDDRVRTLALLSLIGDAGKEILKEAGVKIGQKLTISAINRIPGRVLIEINKRVGFRLLTKAGEKGVVNLIKFVPVAGGLVSGSIDGVTCYSIGKTAKSIFRR